ncbi:uncharacterized protein LOC124125388 [Haliotis rufescens]|uniref:uncharacterized protein LOC124125388 n=1 Tax=Haliotis rufescens TaxID=6454 RepID=UPI001EB02D7A|nr:uncharacterized protein LOC124125388 [Haliotis rufescens]
MILSALCFILAVHLFDNQYTNANDCIVDNMSVQKDLDLDRYVGKWYEYQWYTRVYYPPEKRFRDYSHNYIQTASGNVTSYAIGRDPRSLDGKCFLGHSTLIPTKSAGKFIYSSDQSPYWVMETDYTQYAFVYGCKSVFSNGTCNKAKAWIWSRTPTFPQIIMERAPSFQNTTCLPASSFLDTEQDKECDLAAQYKTILGQSCDISELQMQKDFDERRYRGIWYEIKRLSQTSVPSSDRIHDYQHEYLVRVDGELSVFIRGRRRNSCFYKEKVLQTSETAGKLTFRAVDGPEQYPHWIADTDYDNYAVVYGCLNVSSNGECSVARSSVWSRRPTLAPHFQYRANTVLQNLCVNPAAFLLTPQTNACPAYDSQSRCGTPTNRGTTYTANLSMAVVGITPMLMSTILMYNNM